MIEDGYSFNNHNLGLAFCTEVNASVHRKKCLTAKCIGTDHRAVDDRRGGTQGRSAAMAIN
jgi:hypothetical protein